jgi:hypothetical protein
VIKMRARSIGLAFAALLVLGRTVPGHAQDATAKSAATPSPAPTATSAEAPSSVARPSIAPKSAEPVPATTEEAKPRKHRRHACHHDKRHAHWQPFPIYWPRFHPHRITWHRIRFFF